MDAEKTELLVSMEAPLVRIPGVMALVGM